MSAIIGILSQKHAIEKSMLSQMQQVLLHRGNDDTGAEVLTMMRCHYPYIGVVFNQRYSKGVKESHMPYWNDAQDVMIAYDGEIYNSDELKTEDAQTDAEILMNLYLTLGLEGMIKQLDGTWAMTIVDLRLSKIFIIRDRLGEKPLYVYQKDDLLLFASEYKAFYCHPEFKAVLNKNAVSEYFVFRYACGETTFLQNVINLAAGHYLEISDKGVQKIQYYHLPQSSDNHQTKEANRVQLKKLIHKSVESRLAGTVGVQLSGGVDSSYVCAAVRDITGKPFDTYSVTFEGAQEDESKYVDYVNKQLGLISHKFDCKPSDFLRSWEIATWHYESPMNHEGTLPLYDLNKMASERVTAMLCGDGPDESMGGYPIFNRIDRFYREFHGLRWRGVQLKAWLKGKPHFSSREEHYISLHQFIKDEYVRQLRPHTYKQDIKHAFAKRMEILNQFRKNDPIHRLANFDLATFGADCAMRTEKMAMASGVTIRSPFLNTQLQEFLLTVPPQYLSDYTKPYFKSTKILLKELCAEAFGDAFAYRYKVGLGVPNHEIFADPQVREYVEKELMPSIKRRGIVNYDFVQKIWQLPLYDKRNYDLYLLQVMWVVFAFEVWAKMYIDMSPLDAINK